jgi:sulfur-oxidizing protein SoxY
MTTRRQILAASGALGALALLPGAALATTELRDRELARLAGGARIRDGRVKLTIPGVAENGLSVFTTVDVESPMTDADFVRRIHILAEKNPISRLLTWQLSPRLGVARISTNIRLAASQQVTALAEMSDGTFWRDAKPVVVTVAACIDGG